MAQKEANLQTMVADYLRLQYPNALFHSDFGSGIKLTAGQAMKQKRQNGGKRGWPDMFIAEPRRVSNKEGGLVYCGLFLELKAEGGRLTRKDGTYATLHIEEQAEVLDALNQRGYLAMFAVGFEETKKIIDAYLGGGKDESN